MLKVIIADDEEKICELLEQLVNWKTLGFEIVAFAHNGLEVLEYVRKYQPEVVITDIQMPECNGLELLERIRRERMDIDLLVISGYREFEYAKKALQQGVENYLLKPIKKAELTESLQNIKHRRENRDIEQKKIENTKNILNNSREKLQTKLIEDVLLGKWKKLSFIEMNEEYQCGFEKPHRSWLTVKVDTLSETLDSKVLEILQQKNRNIILSVLAEEDIKCCCMIRGNMLLAVINETVERLERPYSFIIRRIKDFAGRDIAIHVTIGAADVENDNIYKAALESSRAAMDQIFYGRDKIIFYRYAERRIEYTSYLTPKFIQEIYDSISVFDEARLLQNIRGLMNQIRNGENALSSGESIYRCVSSVVDQILLQAQMINKEVNFTDIRNKYNLLFRMCGSWTDYDTAFQRISFEITDISRRLQIDKEKRPIKEAKQIIQERFNTPLTLDEISAELNLNSTYFSGAFKKETGMTVTAYIMKLRIEAAKQLLREKNDSMQTIAENVGYNDEKYFMRKFKAEVGITPGEYRKLYGER